MSDPAPAPNPPPVGPAKRALPDAPPTPPPPPPPPPQPTHLGPPAIQAPWRLSYLESMPDAAPPAPAAGPPLTFLRAAWLNPERDHAHRVVVRSSTAIILLNAFPYSAGHLLVALGDPRPTLLDYTAEQRADLWRHVDAAAELVQLAFQPQGVNIGLNQGRAAGAGVPDHLHVHLVPRWGGDVNFMTVVGQVRVIPAALDATFDRYRAAWNHLAPRWSPLLG